MKLLKPLLLAACAAMAVTPALAQNFPTKPITFVVPFAAGTATDQIARALGTPLNHPNPTNVAANSAKPAVTSPNARSTLASASSLNSSVNATATTAV